MSCVDEQHELLGGGLLTVAEAAKLLAVARSTVYELMVRGELCWIKIGRSRRIPRRELERLARRNVFGGWAQEAVQ